MSKASTPTLVLQKLKMSKREEEPPKIINFSETSALKRNFGRTLDNRKLTNFLLKSPLNTPDKISIRKHITPEKFVKKFDLESVDGSDTESDVPHFRK